MTVGCICKFHHFLWHCQQGRHGINSTFIGICEIQLATSIPRNAHRIPIQGMWRWNQAHLWIRNLRRLKTKREFSWSKSDFITKTWKKTRYRYILYVEPWTTCFYRIYFEKKHSLRKSQMFSSWDQEIPNTEILRYILKNHCEIKLESNSTEFVPCPNLGRGGLTLSINTFTWEPKDFGARGG